MAQYKDPIKVQPGSEVTLVIPTGACDKEGVGKNGQWYKYEAYLNGVDETLFCGNADGWGGPSNDKLMQALAQSITVTLTRDANDAWTVTPVMVPGQPPAPQASLPQAQNTPPPQGAVPAAPPRGKPWGDMVKLMIQCMEQGKHLASGLENATSEDARTIGTSLFIECNRKGITAESIKWEAGKPDDDGDIPLPF